MPYQCTRQKTWDSTQPSSVELAAGIILGLKTGTVMNTSSKIGDAILNLAISERSMCIEDMVVDCVIHWTHHSAKISTVMIIPTAEEKCLVILAEAILSKTIAVDVLTLREAIGLTRTQAVERAPFILRRGNLVAPIVYQNHLPDHALTQGCVRPQMKLLSVGHKIPVLAWPRRKTRPPYPA